MAFNASCITLMIASPSDVVQERVIARDVANEWNAIHARTRLQVLLPVGWETHAIPAMGDRPQALINEQLLKDADILVAVFWTRLGSSTGKAPSGTVEEIEEHIASCKPVMIYFSRTLVTRDSVDAEQYAALTEFRKSLQSRGLYQEFDNAADFQGKFSRHLSQTINNSFPAVGVNGGDITASAIAIPNVGLSTEAAQLLKAASKDRGGQIMVLRHLGGTLVQTNGQSFAKEGDPRSEALWESVVEELEGEMLVVERGHKREVFAVTSQGYQIADTLPN